MVPANGDFGVMFTFSDNKIRWSSLNWQTPKCLVTVSILCCLKGMLKQKTYLFLFLSFDGSLVAFKYRLNSFQSKQIKNHFVHRGRFVKTNIGQTPIPSTVLRFFCLEIIQYSIVKWFKKIYLNVSTPYKIKGERFPTKILQ